MIADYLHSFYRMPVNLVIGGVPTVATLRWFKAPAGAKRLPFPSAIFSHVWDNNPGESVPGEIGEVGSPRTWDPGNNVGYQGQCYRGDPAWFATGNLPPLASIAPSPCLCVIPPAVGSGTLVMGGAALGAVATRGCSQCPNGAQANWRITVAGGTGSFAIFNGSYLAPYKSQCFWQLGTPSNGRVVQYPLGGPWQVALSSGSVSAQYHVSGAFDCLAGGAFNLFFNSPTSGVPAPTVSVGPP